MAHKKRYYVYKFVGSVLRLFFSLLRLIYSFCKGLFYYLCTMQKQVVLITYGFPFGMGEAYLESEIEYLCTQFEKVTIVPIHQQDNKLRKIPQNCDVLLCHIPLTKFQKAIALWGVFSPLFWQEIKHIRNNYNVKISFGILSTLLITLRQSRRIARFLDTKIKRTHNTLFYAYWNTECAISLALLKRKYEIKAVSRMHRWDIYFEESDYLYLPFKKFITDYIPIYSISQDGIDYAVKKWHVKPSVFTLSRLGVVNHSVRIKPNSAPFSIVSCSSVYQTKRVQYIAEALGKMGERTIFWTHFGSGPTMDILKNAVSKLPSNIRVQLPGFIPNTEVLNAYSEIQPHLFINVSSSEGVPVSIMEAMSFGIPVLATNVGGSAEIVNLQNGCLLPSHPNIDEIASEIIRFYEMDASEYKLYSDKAYETWNEKYNAEKNFGSFVKMLDSHLSN